MLINAGIRRVYFAEGYEDALADDLARQAGMELIQLAWEGS
jgi:deoxycytidylate deaminase